MDSKLIDIPNNELDEIINQNIEQSNKVLIVVSFIFEKGLELVLKDGTIFYNHETKRDAVINGEYGLSRCIINNGFTIDCMLEKYKNINWYDGRNNFMNDNNHPSRKNSYFGGSIDPYEVIFHKWFWPGHPYVCLDIIENYTMKKWEG